MPFQLPERSRRITIQLADPAALVLPDDCNACMLSSLVRADSCEENSSAFSGENTRRGYSRVQGCQVNQNFRQNTEDIRYRQPIPALNQPQFAIVCSSLEHTPQDAGAVTQYDAGYDSKGLRRAVSGQSQHGSSGRLLCLQRHRPFVSLLEVATGVRSGIVGLLLSEVHLFSLMSRDMAHHCECSG